MESHEGFHAGVRSTLEAARAGNYLEPAKLAEVEKFLHHPAEWSAAHGGISEFKAAG